MPCIITLKNQEVPRYVFDDFLYCDMHRNDDCDLNMNQIGSGILHQFDWNNSYSSENVISHTNCGFTFVREPISRFVSGYYTTNRLIYFHNLPGAFKAPYRHNEKFKWWNVTVLVSISVQCFVFDYLSVDLLTFCVLVFSLFRSSGRTAASHSICGGSDGTRVPIRGGIPFGTYDVAKWHIVDQPE